MTRHPVSRSIYIALAIGTVATGLALREFGDGMSDAARDITGDALWASMVF
jgi:hypothetical protein